MVKREVYAFLAQVRRFRRGWKPSLWPLCSPACPVGGVAGDLTRTQASTEGAPEEHLLQGQVLGDLRPRDHRRELDDEVLRRAKVYVDSREAAMKESGDVIAAREVLAEIGEVVSGAEQGRRSLEEVTLFKSLGLAVEDVATAELVYRNALGGA
jgi:hypothetical protein